MLGRVDIWRIVPFGNHILNLARLPDLPLSDNISQYFKLKCQQNLVPRQINSDE